MLTPKGLELVTSNDPRVIRRDGEIAIKVDTIEFTVFRNTPGSKDHVVSAEFVSEGEVISVISEDNFWIGDTLKISIDTVVPIKITQSLEGK